ncbi:MAG: hypothetical protein BJ554DRAFT_3799 [Olpidium bornovanus]|uniref:RRM domain-containing protein n=1 Tax=Olpidium bornovanus TaxID=278681 RepID=A0A8H8DFA1_9FUNG|nr:MAG: hypothetical protein BJ554DRAFT_3799 [Olpidium bornovanus]
MYSSPGRRQGGRKSAGAGGGGLFSGEGRGGRGGGGDAVDGVTRIFTRSLRSAAANGTAAGGLFTSGAGAGATRSISIAGTARAAAGSPYSRLPPRDVRVCGTLYPRRRDQRQFPAGFSAGVLTQADPQNFSLPSEAARGLGGRSLSALRGAWTAHWGHDMFDPFEGGRVPKNMGMLNGGATWAGKAAINGQNDLSKRRLLVENLHYEVLEDDLKVVQLLKIMLTVVPVLQELFGSFGTLVKLVLRYDASGRSEGRAEVTFADAGCAKSAMSALNNRLLDGQPMHIKYYEPPPRRESGLYSSGRTEKKGGIFARLGELNAAPTLNRGGGGDRRVLRRNVRPTATLEDLDADMDAYMKVNADPPQTPFPRVSIRIVVEKRVSDPLNPSALGSRVTHFSMVSVLDPGPTLPSTAFRRRKNGESASKTF